MNSVIDYVSNNQICRSQLLLKYFDEKKEKECGKCDICIDNLKALEKNNSSDLELTILNHLKKKRTTINDLENMIGGDKNQFVSVIQSLLDNNNIAYDSKDQLYVEK